MKMVQTGVNSENGLRSRFRLMLKPHLINLNEIFIKCGYDTNQNLLFNAIFIHTNQLATNTTFWVSENIKTTLYKKRGSKVSSLSNLVYTILDLKS